jgi:hypothetical protein
VLRERPAGRRSGMRGDSPLPSRVDVIRRYATGDAVAAKALASISTTPRYSGLVLSLRDALRREASVAAALAAAARKSDRAAYVALRARLPGVTGAINAAVATLKARGFALKTVAAIDVPGPPPKPARRAASSQTQTVSPPVMTPPYVPSVAEHSETRKPQPPAEEEFVTEAK